MQRTMHHNLEQLLQQLLGLFQTVSFPSQHIFVQAKFSKLKSSCVVKFICSHMLAIDLQIPWFEILKAKHNPREIMDGFMPQPKIQPPPHKKKTPNIFYLKNLDIETPL